MKQYTIEIEDTVSEFLEFVSVFLHKPIEVIIADGLFNQVTLIDGSIKKFFVVEE